MVGNQLFQQYDTVVSSCRATAMRQGFAFGLAYSACLSLNRRA
jgi:hypothetical protein